MPLHHLSYQSTALLSVSDTVMQDLLAKSRTYNTAHEVSGMLLYRDGQFVQVLEGEESVVRALYEKIRRDPRHTDVVKLADEPLTQRKFGAWAMAYRP
ncbi:BLUF domain-containing protein [Hymenobacter sp. BT664]|uniref:BLUF domain-containing protein n=1 Tax=Hymenobacter montanus TaxID=2771359 RepID=A0A927BC46_9BACT|nr:BLUF domain-containing protein [Hymenobacter montanus]MBD2767550.1 BLUF domain-containing protein [Hymenobacter montanus]